MSLRTVITDIEGTTSSIAFVKDVLFPYARRALPDFVRAHRRDANVLPWLDQVAAEIGGACTDQLIAETLQDWIDQDRKHTALKALQGMIWKDGYAQGAYQAHIYADAAQTLRQWHQIGHRLFVYSSGSVPAQKLFFAHSAAGDLTPMFSGYFDTEIGGKREVQSYQRIADAVAEPPDALLFLSDVVEELDAARSAGFDTVLLDRREDYPQARHPSHGHRVVTTFADISP